MTFVPLNYHFSQCPGLVLFEFKKQCHEFKPMLPADFMLTYSSSLQAYFHVELGFIHLKTICFHVANLRSMKKLCAAKTWFMQRLFVCYIAVIIIFEYELIRRG